jgi:cyclase
MGRAVTVNKRFIPVLLLDRERRLVKTVRFGERTYIGDPFNVIRIFNEREVDEICVLDIDASADGRAPDVGFIAELASECFMPLAYGGGIQSQALCEQIVRSGVEKIVLGRKAHDLDFIGKLARDFGSQAIVACVDVNTRPPEGPNTRLSVPAGASGPPDQRCLRLQDAGVGEIILQSIDRDGTRQGFDELLLRRVCPQLSVPIIALGGAGTHQHLYDALTFGASAAASGSAFVFIGRLRAVLVTYPEEPSREPADERR